MRKLFCKKCNAQVSKDFLNEVKEYASESKTETYTWGDGGEPFEQIDTSYWIGIGTYVQERHSWNRLRLLQCHPDDMQQGIPEFKRGGGCCNWHMMDYLCSCGEILGTLELDCWQDKRVQLHKKKIRSEIRP